MTPDLDALQRKWELNSPGLSWAEVHRVFDMARRTAQAEAECERLLHTINMGHTGRDLSEASAIHERDSAMALAARRLRILRGINASADACPVCQGPRERVGGDDGVWETGEIVHREGCALWAEVKP